MSFADLTLERYSCRKYEKRAVESEKLDAILEAGRLAPTACNNHPVRVLPCATPELLEKAAACQPRFARDGSVFGAPVVLLVCGVDEDAWVRPYDQMNAAPIDTAIVCDQMMMQATELGLGTCWVCHFKPEIAREQFDLPEGVYRTTCSPWAMRPIPSPRPNVAPSAPSLARISCCSSGN